MSQGLTYTIHFGMLSLAGTVLYTLSNVMFDNQGSSSKIVGIILTIFYAIFAVVLFFANTVSIFEERKILIKFIIHSNCFI